MDLMDMSSSKLQALVGKIPWRRDRLPIPVFLGFPCDSAGKEAACNVGDKTILQDSLENSRTV